MHEKSVFFAWFFRNISKAAETILIIKIEQNHGVLVYKKALMSENPKNNIFRDINCFVKMSVSFSTYVRYQIFIYALAQQLV